MSTELPSWAIVVPQSAENKEELLRQFVRQLRGLCSGEGVELPNPFVYLWEDITQETLAGLADFVDSLLSTTFDFVLCICNPGFDCSQRPHVREDLSSDECSVLYLPFEKIESSFSVVEEVLRSISSCFALRPAKASESEVSSSHQNVPRRTLRTFMSRTKNSQEDFIFIAKDNISIAATKQAASNSHGLSRSYLLEEEGKAHMSSKSSLDARLLLLGVQWLEYSNGSSCVCFNEGDIYTGALNVCSYCKPNVYQARLLDYNQHWWWDLITASAAPLGLMYGALAGRIANIAPPSHLKDIYNNSRDSKSSTASWSKVAYTFVAIPMPSELSDEILLDVVRSYSSRFPSLQWVEEFASVSPQWKQVIRTYWRQIPRLLVDTVKVRGDQLEIWLQETDPQPSSRGPPQPIVLKDEASETASMLRRIAARTLIISLEEYETLEKVLAHVGYAGLHAEAISLEPPGRLVDANVKQIMRSIGAVDRIRVPVTWIRDIEALLPNCPPYGSTFEMDLGSCCSLYDDSSLDLLLYIANSMIVENFVIERYGGDVVILANRMAKKFSSGIASRINMLVVPAYKETSKRKGQPTIALNIRRTDGCRFVAVQEDRGMRMIIGDDRTVNQRISGREDYDALLPLLNRGSSEFEQFQKAVYETLFSRTVGYSDIRQLLQDIKKDYDIDGEQATRRFAYKSLTDFLRSAEMKAKVNVTEDSSGRTVYEATPTAENIHLRWEQQKSAVSVAERSTKKARNEASDARRKVLELERRLRDVPDLERRIRELELEVRQRDETILQTSVALAEAERNIECFCCKDRPIEVVFKCGHAACRACTKNLTTEERAAPGTNQFGVNVPMIRVRKADPKCSQCGESVDPCRPLYAFRS